MRSDAVEGNATPSQTIEGARWAAPARRTPRLEGTTVKKTVLTLTALILGAGLALTGCKATEPFQDAPVSSRDKSPAEVYDMPDGYSNFAEKCDKHGNRIVVVFHGDGTYAGVTAIPNDPSCKQ
jgi:hypothetical protein